MMSLSSQPMLLPGLETVRLRAYHRVLKWARTIADLASSDHIETAQLAEALQYRPRELRGQRISGG